MINNFLTQQIKEYFPYQPTIEQLAALDSLANFILSPPDETFVGSVFILRGYAGTGKTSLIGALVKALNTLQRPPVLLAPTGRAAKVFASYAEYPAYTIHKKIYRQRKFGQESAFSLQENLSQHTLFIIDEASMIANEGLGGSMFGTGRLLDDLIQYVYSSSDCRLLLIGDIAQLPPVGEEESPALRTSVLQGYGLDVTEVNMTEVVRQAHDSGILWNATRLRETLAAGQCHLVPKLKLRNFADVHIVSGSELLDTLSECYGRDGIEQTAVICRSNKQANAYNEGIRSRILYREEEIERGELLMVVKNNYFWGADHQDIPFIANGDTAVVRRIRRETELYGFRFQDMLLAFPDYNAEELEVRLLLDTLHSPAPSLTREESERLFASVYEDYADVPTKAERMKKIKEDPQYNALQVKYAYAITCHKAQGGQWKNVFIDQGYVTAEQLSPNYYRWLYTAFTRATEHLYLINWKE
ncbi:MAG: AAA family ATPase [Prevotellaceae bacterium]|jgi:exodeoxyribonuclease-5|nr:AAA family ATPase [Prevotellaceae bacterium]